VTDRPLSSVAKLAAHGPVTKLDACVLIFTINEPFISSICWKRLAKWDLALARAKEEILSPFSP
jgi:hypothetical protein